MNTNNTRELPTGLQRVRQRFERWRQTRKPRTRIPDSLWAAAVRATSTYGFHRTCRALRLSYYALKERVERQSTTAVDQTDEAPAAPFLELPPSAFARPCECTVEWENVAGAKMRVHLKGTPMPDLAALSRSFWNPAS
jgi:hypothetical protein